MNDIHVVRSFLLACLLIGKNHPNSNQFITLLVCPQAQLNANITKHFHPSALSNGSTILTDVKRDSSKQRLVPNFIVIFK